MTPDAWNKIKEIVADASELDLDERRAFLDQRCPAEFRSQVDDLLDSENTNASRLDGHAVSFSTLTNVDRVNERIGAYRITGALGTGGMGTVYLAERADGEFEQKVALKLIKRGMDSDAILRRFVNERQILASLDHPNIAHLIDGGTTSDGLPFFVLEFIDGETIFDYAARNDLSIAERLDLFRSVCSAVSFAHQNLVVHRDLKPSNILVTKDGAPKLLDFGIAKLLRAESENAVTATQNFVFTPEYASPEQVRGENLTTATDIYSLGVILYELLTGSRPYKPDISNISDIIRAVCETEPKRPSSVVVSPSYQATNSTAENKGHTQETELKTKIQNLRSLKGDLDNIILKALRKEPERRYASVEQFSDDLRRHLKGLPVTACSDTWNYRTAKFMRRNRVGVGAAAMLLITLIAGLGATLYQRNKAERRFNDVRQLANSFMFEINDQIVKSPIKARELLVQRALEYLDKLAAEAGNDAELQSELATAYEKIGDVQVEAFRPNLGKTSEGLVSHRKALELREKLYAAAPTVEHGVQVANSHFKLSSVWMMSGQIAESRAESQRSVEILESLLAADSSSYLVRRGLASAYARQGQSVLRSGSLDESLSNYEKSLELFQALNADHPEKVDVRRGVGIVFSYIAFVRMEKGQAADAVEYYGKWLEIEEELAELARNEPGSSSDINIAHTWYGVALSEQGREKEAIDHLTIGVKLQELILARDKDNFAEHTALADANLELGKVRIKYKHTSEAVSDLENALKHYRIVWQNDQASLFTKHRIAAAQRFLADALMQRNELKKALDMYEQSCSTFQELTAKDPNQTDWQVDLAVCHLRVGEYYVKTKQSETAVTNFNVSLPILEKLSTASPENVKRRRDLETVKAYLAQL